MMTWGRAFAIVSLLLLARPLRAEDSADALISQGVALRKQGKNAEALIDFQRAYQMSPSPRAQAQIALAEQALGDWIAAEDGLVSALAAQSDPFVARNRSPLTAALDTVRDHLGRLRVESNVAAGVFIDGRSIGRVPNGEPFRVVAGQLAIELRADGFESVRREVTVEPRGEASVRIDLLPPPPSAAAVATPPIVTPAPAPAPTLGATQPESPRRVTRASGIHTAAIVTLVGGGVLLAGAVTAHITREWYASRYNDDSFCPPRDRVERCSAYLHGANTTQTLAIVGYSAAGAALLTSLILFVVAPNESPSFAAVGSDGSVGWKVAF